MHKLLYSFSIKIFRLMSQPVAHNTFDFIVTFKLCASRKLFQGTKPVKAWRCKVWAEGEMREQFSAYVVDGPNRLGCCVRPCVVMMQDDSFWLLTPTFVLYVFLEFVLYVCPLRLFFMFVLYETPGTIHCWHSSMNFLSFAPFFN